MLSIGKLSDGGSAGYYEQAVASGREDYYSGRGEAGGQWVGAGAEELGLAGDVPAGALSVLLSDGADPATGDRLRSWPGSVLGFDLTFSAPKSVSVLYAAGDESVRRAVVAAHEAAVGEALGYLERTAVQVRRGHGGAIREHASGLIAAAYRHRTSRAGDPQLHTHVVAANFARGADGRYTALHGAALYTHAKTAGYLYQAALRAGLSRELGVEWTAVSKGFAEIRGIPDAVLVHFSQRRAEIVERLAALGASSPSAARVATLDTRRAKQYGVGGDIYADWRARAAEHGLDRAVIATVLGRDVERGVDVERAAALMTGSAGLTAHASTFTRREVLQAWCEQFPQGARVERIEALCDRWLASSLVVQVDGPPTATTRLGRLVAAHEARYTTAEMLAAERALLDRAQRGRAAGRGMAGDPAVATALARRPTIRDEQAAMVEQLCRSGDAIDAVRGHAGTGKTFALDAAADAWRQSGVAVAGVALSGKAADVLRDEAAIPSSTIAQLFAQHDRYGDRVLDRGQVLVVDEAGMVGTRDLTRLAQMTDAVDGKLVLIGDTEQLAEIDAGGAFRALVEDQRGVELSHVSRQRDPLAIEQLRAIREGRAGDALASMREHSSLVLHETAEQTRSAIIADWLAGHARADEDGPAFMVAKRNADVRELNERARAALLARGELGEQATVLDGRQFRVGERVIAGVNDRRHGVRNGTTATIERIDHDARSLALRTDRGADLQLPFDYAAGRTRTGRAHLDYGYAVTVHRAQGDTWGRVYYLGGEDSHRQEAYTALSRARHTARFYATVPAAPDREHRPDVSAGLEPLARALGRDDAKTLALDVARDGALHGASDEDLRREAQRLRPLTRSPAAVAVDALEQINARLAQARRQLADRQRRMTDLERHIAKARRRERSTLKPALHAHQRVVEDDARQVGHLEDQRGAVIDRVGDPGPWLRARGADVARLAAVELELAHRQAHREHLARQAVTRDPPPYITDAIGKPPPDPRGRTIWSRAAHTIHDFRQRHAPQLPADVPGLGPQPSDERARSAWHRANRHVAGVQRELHDRALGRERWIDIAPDR